MGYTDQPTLERPRVANMADAEFAALYALCIAVSAAKRSALCVRNTIDRAKRSHGETRQEERLAAASPKCSIAAKGTSH
jgi:hypothetical protein